MLHGLHAINDKEGVLTPGDPFHPTQLKIHRYWLLIGPAGTPLLFVARAYCEKKTTKNKKTTKQQNQANHKNIKHTRALHTASRFLTCLFPCHSFVILTDPLPAVFQSKVRRWRQRVNSTFPWHIHRTRHTYKIKSSWFLSTSYTEAGAFFHHSYYLTFDHSIY